MSWKINANKKTHNRGIKTFPKWLLRTVISIYVFIILSIYPLATRNKYYDIGDFKYEFFKNVTLVAMITMLVLLPIHLLCEKDRITWKLRKATISLTDLFVFGYLVASILSFILSNYKDSAVEGWNGWFMGVFAQIAFVLIYLFVSRFWKWDSFAVFSYLGVAAVVFLFAILHRFLIDPLGFYDGLNPAYFINFLTTQGQATWYSSYLCAIFPLGLFFFWHCKKNSSRAFATIFTVLSFSTLVTQNSDSAFIALTLVLMVFFWFSMESNEKWKRFWEIVIVMLTSFRVMGLLQLILKKRAVQLEDLSIFASQHWIIAVTLIIAIVIYLVSYKLEVNGKLDITKFKILRKIMIWAAAFVVAGMVAIIVANTKGILGHSFKGYLFFDKSWGNGRGFTWAYSVDMFRELPLLQKIFGVGPDCFAAYSYEYHAEYLNTMWGNSILPNAHNEWLNSLLCYGIVGAIAYIGIFLTAVKRFFGNASKKPILIAFGACILSYMGHNLFCYQQCICTPTIFILIGIGEYIARTDGFKNKLTFLGNSKC